MAHSPTISPEGACSFRVAIRITHPSAMPASITNHIGRAPDVVWAVGSQRLTPKGNALPGTNKESYWLLRGPDSDDLPRLIEWANDVLEGAGPFVRDLLSTGGRLEYFIGCFVDRQLGASLDPSLISKCADLGAALVFDMYGELKESTSTD
jgi:hypothetical protein